MTGFLGKLRVVTLASVHDLLDQRIDMNSPSILKQYVRDLEDALDKMKLEAATQGGQVRTLSREYSDLQHQIELGRTTITNLLKAGSNDAARVKGQEVVRLQGQVQSKSDSFAAAQKASQQLDLAVARLSERHDQMLARVRDLEQLDRDSKAKEQAAHALESAGALVQGGADISVDDIESRMMARNDVASEKFDRAMNVVKVEEDPQTSADVDDLLNSLKPKVETKSETTTAA